MGGNQSTHDWHPPPNPRAVISNDSPVEYHMVGSEVSLGHNSECACFPKVNVSIDCDELYAMMAEQYSKGYRMVHFTRVPANLKSNSWQQTIKILLNAFYRINPNIGDRYESVLSWQLRVDRCFLQSVETTSGYFSPQQKRNIQIANMANCIARNTQNGERLVAATATGQEQSQTYKEYSSGMGSYKAMDLFFEVPSPVPRERYIYDIVLVPVHVEFVTKTIIFFPEIICDWMTILNEHLSQGWRLIDIHMDIPMIEQLRVPLKQRRMVCLPLDTNAVWIFEKPMSRSQDPTPLYEATIVEQPAELHIKNDGVSSAVDWLPVIRDMGHRGWELSCVVESHSVDASTWGSSTIKSLLFFQRPVA